MAVYDLRNTKNYNISPTAVSSTAGGASKFLNENLTTENITGVKLVGTRSNGDDVLIAEETFKKEVERLVLKPFLKTFIGRIISNISNNIVAGVWNDGYFEYILLDGREIKKTDYPDLFNFFGITADVFNLPNFEGRYEKNKIIGENRVLGSVQEDSIKSHSITSNQVQPTTQAHNHTVSGLFNGLISGGPIVVGSGPGKESYQGSQTTSSKTVIINPFTVTCNYIGSEFNEVKNILKTSYIVSKVII